MFEKMSALPCAKSVRRLFRETHFSVFSLVAQLVAVELYSVQCAVTDGQHSMWNMHIELWPSATANATEYNWIEKIFTACIG